MFLLITVVLALSAALAPEAHAQELLPRYSLQLEGANPIDIDELAPDARSAQGTDIDLARQGGRIKTGIVLSAFALLPGTVGFLGSIVRNGCYDDQVEDRTPVPGAGRALAIVVPVQAVIVGLLALSSTRLRRYRAAHGRIPMPRWQRATLGVGGGLYLIATRMLGVGIVRASTESRCFSL